MARTVRKTRRGQVVRDGETLSRGERRRRQHQAYAGHVKIRQHERRAIAVLEADPEADIVLPTVTDPVRIYRAGAI